MPQPGADPQLIATIVAAQQASQQLRTNLLAYIAALWQSLGSWRDQDIPRFVASVVPAVAGAQQRMAAITSASLTAQRQAAFGSRFTPPPVDATRLTGAAVRMGVDPAEEYARPFHEVWAKLDTLPRQPGSISQAISDGLLRAKNLAATDLQLTKRAATSADSQYDDKLIGYRRVLEGTFSCALCIVASTLVYKPRTVRDRGGALYPIHPGCDCGLEKIYDPADVERSASGFTTDSRVRLGDGRIVSLAELSEAHDRIRETFGRADAGAREFGVEGSKGREIAYRDVIVAHDHGELGRVLAVRGQHFDGRPGSLGPVPAYQLG